MASTALATLPGRYYVDPDIFLAEQERIFATEWVYVARSDELSEPGDVVRCSVGGESVILVRGRAGELRGFIDACRHRGSRLSREDRANVGNAIRCPYHSWCYGLDGRLVAAPNGEWMDDETRSSYSLLDVAVAVWHGLVWVSLASEPRPFQDQLAPQLDYRFGGDADRIDRYGLGDLVVGESRTYDVAANWKIIQENFQECYHCSTIHPELIEQIPVFASLDLLGTDGYFTGGYDFAAHKEAFSLSGAAHHPLLEGLTTGDERKYFGMVLRPNCFVSLLPDHAIVHKFEAVGPALTRVVCDWLFPHETVASAGFDPHDAVEMFHRVNVQDFTAAERCQPNMSSRAYRDGGVLVPTEAEIIGRWYYPWYHRVMAGA